MKYSLAVRLAHRYKQIIEEHNSNYVEDDLWWFVDGLESGALKNMNPTLMHIWIGYIVGQLTCREWAVLAVERRLIRQYLRMYDEQVPYGRHPARVDEDPDEIVTEED